MSRKKIVYWSADTQNNNKNWNILYPDLKSLYDTLKENENTDLSNGFFKCPSFINKAKNIFVVNNPLHSEFLIENEQIIPRSITHLNANIFHQGTIKNNFLVQYGLYFYFFAEEDLEMSLTSPFFQKAPHLQYGAVVPGGFNIGSWFRRTGLEFNLWENINELKIKEGEPVAYYSFAENTNIELRRFSMSNSLYEIEATNSSSSIWEPNVSLKKRYQRFKASRTNDLVLREIKKNLF